MRIALLQTEAVPRDVEANLATLRARAAEARAAGAELVLTPELFITGYAPNALRDWLGANDVDGIPAQLAQLAAETRIAVAASGHVPWGGVVLGSSGTSSTFSQMRG